jgi:hypothetical protein
VGAADKDEASTRPESARYRGNEEVLVSADEVPEGAKTDGKGENARERKVARIGAHEMDRRVTGRVRRASASIPALKSTPTTWRLQRPRSPLIPAPVPQQTSSASSLSPIIASALSISGSGVGNGVRSNLGARRS